MNEQQPVVLPQTSFVDLIRIFNIPLDTNLFEWLNGYTHPVSLVEPSAAQTKAFKEEEKGRKKEFLPYQIFGQNFFLKEDGKLYSISENRKDFCERTVKAYVSENPTSELINNFFLDLLVCANQIEASRIYVPIFLFTAQQNLQVVKDYFSGFYRAFEGLKMGEDNGIPAPGLKELLRDKQFDVDEKKRQSLLTALGKMQKAFETVEKKAIEWKLSMRDRLSINPKEEPDKARTRILTDIDQALQQIDLSPLQEIRAYIENKLGNKTVGDLINDDKMRSSKEERSDTNMNEYAHIRNRLQQIISLAVEKVNAQKIEHDQYGVATVFLTREDAKTLADVDVLMEGRELAGDSDVIKKNKRVRVEVRFFDKGAYQRTKTEDFIEKVEFFAEVAASLNPAAKTDIEKVRAEFKLVFEGKDLKLEAKKGSTVPKNYETVLKKAGDTLWAYQAALVGAVYPGDPRKAAEKIKDLKAAGQQYLIDNGRPIIVHVFPPDKKNKSRRKISAQFPKGKTTYPSDYRHSEEEGVNPNSTLDVTAELIDKVVRVKSVGSRAVSYSVLQVEEDAKRKALNVANAKQDIIDRLILEKRPLVPGQVIEVSSISLLTPLNKVGNLAGKFKKGYQPETRQVLDHNEALAEELDGEEITVNGITVKLSTLHINISVKEPGSIEAPALLVNDSVLKKINDKGFKKYKDKQTAVLEKRENALQRKYFFEVDHDYESESYKTSEYEAFLFASKFIRSEELRGALVSWSCKSTCDRSEHLASGRTALVDVESDGLDIKTKVGKERFDESLLENQDYGAGKRANAMRVSGFGANRVDDFSKQRKNDKLDSMTSNLSKAKYSEKIALEILSSSTEKDRDVTKELNDCLAQLPDGNFKNLVIHLREIKNPYLRAAMVKALQNREADASAKKIHADKFKEAVEKINNLFPDKYFTQREFKKKCNEFLEIVSGAFGLGDMQANFFAALMTDQWFNQKELIEELKSNPDQIPEYLKQLDTAILLVKKFNRWEALKLSLLRKRLENIAPELRIGKPGVDEKPERVWVFDGKTFGKSLTPEQAPSEDMIDQDVMYESKNQLRYKPKMDSKPDLEVIKQVIEFAKKKFKVDSIDDLEFEGSDILIAQVEKIKQEAESKKSELIKKTPEPELKDVIERVETADPSGASFGLGMD